MPTYHYHCPSCPNAPLVTIAHGANQRPARDQRACPACGNLLQKTVNTTVAFHTGKATAPADPTEENADTPATCEQGHTNCPGHAIAEQLLRQEADTPSGNS